MLAALRAAVPELARGFSTALTLWSAVSSCPSTTCSPTLHCPELARVPDCVCQGGGRHIEVTGYSLFTLLQNAFLALIVGLAGGSSLGFLCRVPVSVVSSAASSEVVSEDSEWSEERYKEEARLQVANIRQNAGGRRSSR